MQTEFRTTASRAMSAGAWTVGSRVTAKVIDLGMLVCLARFLGPAEFGLVATAMAAVFVVEALFELPVAAALIRVPAVTPDMLHTAFTLSLLRGSMIAVLLLLISVPLSAFNEEPRLTGLLAMLSLAPVLRGLVSPRLVEYARVFNFRPDAAMELSGKTVAFAVSVSIAVTTRSYWAIVAATVCAPLVSTTLSYVIAPLRPRLTLARWKDFSNLIGWNFIAQLCGALNWQIDRLILPRFTTNAQFGQYAMGKQLSEIPIQALIAPLNRPVMAALASSGASMGPRYLQLSQAVALLLVPVLGIPLLWPEALIRLGLGVAWTSAAEWLRWISAVAILGIPAMLLSPLAMTLDRTRWLAVRTVVELAVRVPLICLGVIFLGIPGAIGASAVATACGTLVALFVVRHLVGTSLAKQIMTLWRPMAAMLPAGAVLWLSRSGFTDAETFGELLVHIVPALVLCLIVYTLAALLMWRIAGRPPGLERQLSTKFCNLLMSAPRRLHRRMNIRTRSKPSSPIKDVTP